MPVLLTKFQRYDEIEFLSDRFVARVADQFLRAVVPKLNNAVLVGNDDRVLIYSSLAYGCQAVSLS